MLSLQMPLQRREHSVHRVLLYEGAQYVLQCLFEIRRQMMYKGGTGWVYTVPEITPVCGWLVMQFIKETRWFCKF